MNPGFHRGAWLYGVSLLFLAATVLPAPGALAQVTLQSTQMETEEMGPTTEGTSPTATGSTSETPDEYGDFMDGGGPEPVGDTESSPEEEPVPDTAGSLTVQLRGVLQSTDSGNTSGAPPGSFDASGAPLSADMPPEGGGFNLDPEYGFQYEETLSMGDEDNGAFITTTYTWDGSDDYYVSRVEDGSWNTQYDASGGMRFHSEIRNEEFDKYGYSLGGKEGRTDMNRASNGDHEYEILVQGLSGGEIYHFYSKKESYASGETKKNESWTTHDGDRYTKDGSSAEFAYDPVTGRLSKSTYIKWGGDNSSEARETQTVTTYTYAATLETITSLQTVTDMRNGEVRARKYEYALQQWEDSSRQKIILASNVFDMKFFSPDGDTRIKMEYGYGLFLEDGREIETHTFTSTRSGAPTEVTVVKIGPNRGLIEITRAGGAVCNSDSTREEWTQCVDGIWDYIHDRFTKFSLQGSLYNSSPPQLTT